MPVEPSVTQISDLNESWPLGTDTRSTLDDHCRLIKKAVKSLLTNPGQIGVPAVVAAETPSGVAPGLQPVAAGEPCAGQEWHCSQARNREGLHAKRRDYQPCAASCG